MAVHPTTGTINCLSLNTKGEMSGVTTTSGLAWKIAGRVGDSPIIGAGLYVDQDVGAAGSTGRGEENIRVAGGHTVVENMRHGMSPHEACLDALKRVARNFDNDRSRLEKVGLNFYALRKDGEYAGASLWNGDMYAEQFKPCDLRSTTAVKAVWRLASICWSESARNALKSRNLSQIVRCEHKSLSLVPHRSRMIRKSV